MKLFEGKTPTERNKIIAAGVLGVLALFTLYLAFGGSILGGKTAKAGGSPTPTPKSSPSPGSTGESASLPPISQQEAEYMVQPIVYNGGSQSAPDAGRNIFAFYEPGIPTPYSPTPPPIVIEKPQPPPPQPTVGVSFVNPPGVYAGTKAFRLEVNGDRFTPEVRIYFQGSEMPTTFVNSGLLTTEIPANFITQEGSRIIEVRSPDGKLWSNQFTFNVQAAPRPQFQYVGMIARKRANNDTAYFQESGKPNPFSARLNDVIGGRFRLVSISAGETVFEDTSLGFRHKLAIFKAAGTPTSGSSSPMRPDGFPGAGGGFQPFNPSMPNPNPNNPNVPSSIPGIPDGIPRATPFQPANNNPRRPTDKKDVDDNDDDDDGDN